LMRRSTPLEAKAVEFGPETPLSSVPDAPVATRVFQARKSDLLHVPLEKA
jgi:hypothetical protein